MQGQQLDAATGLFYNRHRFYDPQAGRYVNQDPIGLAGGSNLAIYPLNPLQRIDPLGLNPTPSLWEKYVANPAESLWEKYVTEPIDKGKATRIESETLTCKRAEAKEKRYDEERQNRVEDRAAVVRDGMAVEGISTLGKIKSVKNAQELYGYMTAELPTCDILLKKSPTVPDFDFFKK